MNTSTDPAVTYLLNSFRIVRQTIEATIANAYRVVTADISLYAQQCHGHERPAMLVTGDVMAIRASFQQQMATLKQMCTSPETAAFLPLIKQLEESVFHNIDQLERYDVAIGLLERQGAKALDAALDIVDDTVGMPAGRRQGTTQMKRYA